MPGFTRVNGSAQPGSWYGLNPRYFKVDTGNITIDTNYTSTLSNFENVAFAISSVASIVTLGTPSGNAFVVQVDDTFGGRGTDSAKVTLAAAVTAAIPTANVVTVTESTGFVGSTFNTFA